MKLLSQNSKMKKTSKITGKKTYNFSLPAVKTCPFAGDCKKYCYAKRGAFTFPSVKSKHNDNYLMTMNDDFAMLMVIEIIESKVEAVRIHDTGDFYNKKYLYKWIEIVKALPHVKFYTYTKSIALLKGEKLPSNITIVYSFGGLQDSMIDVKKDRHAKIFELGYMPNDYAYTDDNDHVALGINKKIGLIKH